MLYPKEDRRTQTLMYACRTCPFSEPSTSSCVFRNNLIQDVTETAGVTQDVGTDPTVCHTRVDSAELFDIALLDLANLY
jgi:DNA-directed RNA polymerase II subunit RPB9